MAIYDHYNEEARAIQKRFKDARAAIQSNRELSPEGKRAQIQRLEERRQSEVAELTQKATDLLNGRKVTLNATLRREGEQRLEAKRKLLGDAVLADIYRRELEALDPHEIVEKYQEVSTEWEKAVVLGYAQPILSTRLRDGDANARVAWDEITQAAAQNEPEGYRKASAEMRDIDEALKKIDQGQLDVERHNHHIADVFGINAAYVE